MAKAKSEYWLTAEGLLLLEAWARDGLTDKQIAKNMGISRSTLSEWKKNHSDISDTLKKGKEVADIIVENALYARAIGCTIIDLTEERVLNEETEEYEFIITKRVTKGVAPDVRAQTYWLKNRCPEKWRDIKVTEIAGEDGLKIEMPEVQIYFPAKEELE